MILQEIAATRDSPDDIVYDLLQDAAFPGQPIGRPILGTRRASRGFAGATLKRFWRQHYGAGHMVLVGRRSRRSRRAACATLRPYSARLTRAVTAGRVGAGPVSSAATRLSAKPFEQSPSRHGLRGTVLRAGRSSTRRRCSPGCFGGGMSSRLFQEVAGAPGPLLRDLFARPGGWPTRGLFGSTRQRGPSMMGELIEVVGGELSARPASVRAEAELARAKAQLKAGLLMGLESSQRQGRADGAPAAGLRPAAAGRDELIDRVEEVTPEAVRDIAASLVTGSPLSFALVGAGEHGQAYASLAEPVARM